MQRRAFLVVLAIVFAVPVSAQSIASDPALRIYVARHGESEANVAGVATGWTDAALTARGRAQAQALADVLRGIPLDAVYSSTLSRSRDTAEAAAGGRRVRALDALRERNWGRFTAKSATDPEFIRRRVLDDDALEGGETKAAFYQRVRDTVLAIRRDHPTGAVLIVGHGATNAQILRALLDLTPAQTDAVSQDNDEVYAIDFVADGAPLLWKLIQPHNLGDL